MLVGDRLFDELFAAMNTKLVPMASTSGMRFFRAMNQGGVCVYDFATVGAIAHRRIGISVIHVGAQHGFHFDSLSI